MHCSVFIHVYKCSSHGVFPLPLLAHFPSLGGMVLPWQQADSWVGLYHNV